MAKKLSKEQLETDALVTSYARTVMYVRENTGIIIGIVVAILVLISSIIGLNLYGKSQERAAQAFLGYSEKHFVDGEYDLALEGDFSTYGVGLKAIIASYPRTNAANLARYYAAISKSELGDDAAALEFMRGFKPPSGILGVGAISFHAVLLDDTGHHSEAAAMFRKAADWDDNQNTTPQNLLRAAQSAMLAGDKRLANQLVNELLDRYPNSPATTNAKKISGMVATK